VIWLVLAWELRLVWLREVVAACTGKPVGPVVVVVEERPRFPCGGDPWAVACWRTPDTIVVSRGHLSIDSVVKHELVHVALQRADHPTPPFRVCER
jgi:hypothetical protein